VDMHRSKVCSYNEWGHVK